MEPQVIEYKPVVERNSWIELITEKLRYIYVTLFLIYSVSVGAQSLSLEKFDDAKEVIEQVAKYVIRYNELDQTQKTTLSDALTRHPELMEIYHYIDQKVVAGDMPERHKKIIQQILNRELWRYFREPLEFYLATTEVKNWVNVVNKANAHQSMGVTDLRANRITNQVYQHLPSTLRDRLSFDETHGHVNPEDLFDAVSLSHVDWNESLRVAVEVYAAMLKVYDSRLQHLTQENNFTDEQHIYLGAMLACCSTPYEDGTGDFALQILTDPTRMEEHWKTEVPDTIRTLITEQEWPVTHSGHLMERVVKRIFIQE